MLPQAFAEDHVSCMHAARLVPTLLIDAPGQPGKILGFSNS